MLQYIHDSSGAISNSYITGSPGSFVVRGEPSNSLLLAGEEAEEHTQGAQTDSETGENQQADKENFESNNVIHGFKIARSHKLVRPATP